MKKEKDWKRCTGVLIITSVCGKSSKKHRIIIYPNPGIFGTVTERNFWKINPKGTYTKCCKATLWICVLENALGAGPAFRVFQGFTDKG